MEKHFLEQYKTQDKPEAKKAAERKEQRTGEKGIFQNRSERIRAYIERLEHVFLNPDPKVRERNIELLRPTIYENAIIKEENFPESYFEFQKQELKNRGFGDTEFSEEDKQKEITRVQDVQRKSLDAWIEHLSSGDSHYPADIKYFAMQGILKLGSFDQKSYRFGKRVESTTASFHQIDHEALSMVMGALEAVHHTGDVTSYHPELRGLIERNKDFGSMYAEAMRHLDREADKDKSLEITEGEWRIFRHGSDPRELVKAFDEKRAYLCLGNIGDASGYLERGDVQVYFSNNRRGKPVWPRVAIAVKPDMGAYEMRGTYNANEDIDPEIAKTDIIKNRLATVPNGESFAKKDTDMRQLTELYQKCFNVDKKTKEKTYLNPELTKNDLVFLYEINGTIEGFGYGRDPRVAELRSRRNPKEDMLVVFECTKAEIARTPNEINGRTKAYVGPICEVIVNPKTGKEELAPEYQGFFQKLPENLEHVYTSFPERKIRKEDVVHGGKFEDQLRFEIETISYISDYGKSMLKNEDFVMSLYDNTEAPRAEWILKKPEKMTLIRLTVADLGFKSRATTDQIYERAQILGLELCSPDTGPNYRLKYQNQPLNEWIYMGMKQIPGSDGYPSFFELGRDDRGLWLSDAWAEPDNGWHPGHKFVFRLRLPVEASYGRTSP